MRNMQSNCVQILVISTNEVGLNVARRITMQAKVTFITHAHTKEGGGGGGAQLSFYCPFTKSVG